MDVALKQLLNKLYHYNSNDIIKWGSPVVSFGDVKKAKIATIGINPSNREFVDAEGIELSENNRRFHTLNSLGIKNWTETSEEHICKMINSFTNYFSINPYDGWFKKLDYIIAGSAISYYFPSGEACHLDLVPFATAAKWSNIPNAQKEFLLKTNIDFLGELLENSEIKVIVLNGQTVVDNFAKITNIILRKTEMPTWLLKRKSTSGVSGYSYVGYINKVGEITLKNEIKVLGYNHNIQSSFGVTNAVSTAIRNWMSNEIKEIIYEKQESSVV